MYICLIYSIGKRKNISSSQLTVDEIFVITSRRRKCVGIESK